MDILKVISDELNIKLSQVEATVKLNIKFITNNL